MCEPGLQKQIEIYRGMTGSQRLQVGFELYDLARALVRSGVLFGHPDWSESLIQEEVNRRFRLAAGIP
jgi:Rv0078B-related antitoxin